MAELAKKYKHKNQEKHWQGYWLENGTYHWDESQPRENTYVIDTPPPTVSGLLHMGHVFSYTQADFIARFQRMKGKTVFYPMGFDDNGLPTERLVEKTKKVRATDMSREDFTKLCESVAEEARSDFRDLFQSTAMSVDWRQEYHTISDESRKLSQMSFLDLFHKGKTYRTLRPMLWDPIDQTAIAQAEVEDKELESHFSDIIFKIDNSSEEQKARSGDRASHEQGEAVAYCEGQESVAEANQIIIGTTRPEMIPACVAIFYHPEDTRYQHLKGKQAITPLFGVKVPILTDDTVEMDKGTGIMMCCTFGDEADIEKWKKHNLDMRIVLNKYGKMDLSNFITNKKPEEKSGDFSLQSPKALGSLSEAGSVAQEQILEQLTNLKAKVARTKILEMLEESGDLVESKPITHAVKCAERSGAPLEILPTEQWFVKVMDQKAELKAKAAECNWNPEWMKLRIDQWIDGLSMDWCISRQRYFGVPFPIWYSKRAGEEGKVLIADIDQLPCNPLTDLPKDYSRDEVEAEADVMDTWATSSISPQLSSRGITPKYTLDAKRHNQLFPADLRPQAHEIIRTWAFYTIVKAYLHENTIPWKNLMISGWCLASDKTKMSKSKGNVVTPVKLIEEKGTDAVRYWASTSKLGTDSAFSEDLLKIGNKLVTKIFNASKFAAMQLENLTAQPTTAKADIESGIITETLDKWIISRLNKAIKKADQSFDKYEYADARSAAEDFFWNDFCDNYLELAKSRSYGNDTEAGQQSACHTIYHCLNGILKLFAPIVPHITEEVFSCIFEDEFKEKGSIHARGMWADANLYPADESAEQAGIYIVELLEAVRKAKSEKNLSIKYQLTETKVFRSSNVSDPIWHLLPSCNEDLKATANTDDITWSDDQASAEATTTENSNFRTLFDFAKEADVA